MASGTGEIGDPSTQPAITPQGINDITPPSSFASHPFSLSPRQPLTPINWPSAAGVSPTMTWNEGDSDYQSRQRQTVATVSPRINLNGEPSSSSGSVPSRPPSSLSPGEIEQHSGKGNNRD
eukprot:1170185-Heterocapsa_arctica.AAC.1